MNFCVICGKSRLTWGKWAVILLSAGNISPILFFFLIYFITSYGCALTQFKISGAHPRACRGAGWNIGVPQCTGIRQERKNADSVAVAHPMSQCCFGADGLASATNVGSAKRRGGWGQSTRSTLAWNESLLTLKAMAREGKQQTEHDGNALVLNLEIWRHPNLIGVLSCSAESFYLTTLIQITVIKLLYLCTFNLLRSD